jgi:hypothetical protein
MKLSRLMNTIAKMMVETVIAVRKNVRRENQIVMKIPQMKMMMTVVIVAG